MSTIKPVIVIHGGAGTISRHSCTAQKEQEYHAALQAVLAAGQAILAEGGSATDAVTQAVTLLEDCPLFNAGKGAVFTHAETHELDAAIMNGADLQAGALSCVNHIKHPIQAARAIMEHSDHVLFVGAGAEDFARQQGLELVDNSYFSTDARREQLYRVKNGHGGMVLDHSAETLTQQASPIAEEHKFGTVGAVALDRYGNLAAATSTGGMTNKQAGRVGDSPILGAGTYADNQTAAISCTGTGEMFMRMVTAYDVCALMRYAGLSLAQATEQVVMEKLPTIGGEGGLVAVDAQGNISLAFNSEGMYRGYAYVGEEVVTAIFR
ncbi:MULTISPECIES: isoaspartyl peptidase/L-asparaginase family protein [Serratia]|uniref:Isoaspartyl peptidase n=1 Tax=Serratia oryzae TaxID=2034155 RepID=A0A1S8CJ09_9GAMM|nr:isoaspartyl peptidase/L-asparaginase [Serratia oryzae]OMQ21847.1 beta-aspartyl-peptidase [Serratia oryzae]VXC95348.1 isoaspartyl dipeptidase with L-asparaginase activity [Enterobacterales bacterium 8AC]